MSFAENVERHFMVEWIANSDKHAVVAILMMSCDSMPFIQLIGITYETPSIQLQCPNMQPRSIPFLSRYP